MNYIVIRVHKPRACLSQRAAKLLLDYVLLRCRRQPWSQTAVEAFSGSSGALLLLRPLPAETVRLADYALPLLLRYARRASGVRGKGAREK